MLNSGTFGKLGGGPVLDQVASLEAIAYHAQVIEGDTEIACRGLLFYEAGLCPQKAPYPPCPPHPSKDTAT